MPKEKVNRGLVLIIQREGKERKKNSCFEQPHEVSHLGPRWIPDSIDCLGRIGHHDLWGLTVNCFAHRFSRFEVGNSLFRYLDTLAGARVPAQAWRPAAN